MTSSMAGGIIASVAPDSVAEALGLQPGDELISINGRVVRDVLDVQFYAADEEFELVVRRGDGQTLIYEVERDYDVPLGLDFVSPTFDELRRCDNRCEFCFIAQMPPRTRGLRRSLYVRDDDYRYSVLYGSFITLTNLGCEDWQRFEEQRLSPLYISVHATEPDLRRHLLGRQDIPDILQQIDRLAALGIEMHTQVVLMPGLNDGSHLARTIADLAWRYPAVQSIGIVPVGLTHYHRGNCQSYTSMQARSIIGQIEPVQAGYRKQFGISLVYLADEWYLLAGVAIPGDELYDDYAQIENGIGLTRQFLDDYKELEIDGGERSFASCTLACGTLIAPLMGTIARDLSPLSGIRFDVVPVSNRLFGETVTVSGLLGGEDVITALQQRDLGEVVCLPRAMFDDSAERTLDDLTVDDFARRLNRPVIVAGFISDVLDKLTNSP